jgi:putative DNA primase/helicase
VGVGDKPDDPFANVSKSIAAGGDETAGEVPERKRKSRSATKPKGEWVCPVPADAPPARTSHNRLGKPSASWPYRDAEGRLMQWVCRFELSDGGKETPPQTLWREGGKDSWRWAAPPVPRPLYGLDRLAKAPTAPVLIVEGEKTADAAAELFSDFAIVTWSGGSKAVSKADWEPLAGRRVVIVPDADAPGREASQAVQKAVLAARAEGAAIAQLPATLPAGWDCADQFPPGFAFADLSALIGVALDAASAGQLAAVPGYTLEADGLYWHEPGKDGADPRAIRLSDPFEIAGEVRNAEGDDWGLLVRFRDRDGVAKSMTVKRAALASDAGAVRATLAAAGLLILSATGQSDRFIRYLRHVIHSARLTLAERTGWNGRDRFVLPNAVIAPPGAEPVHFDGAASALNYRQKGSLDGWRRDLASLAPGNSRLAFAISLAFVGPIMRWLDMEGGGFHARGPSSGGKTSMLMGAGSVWGGGGSLGYASSWRATSNALEGVAHGHTDTLLCLDELALVDPQEAGPAAYAIASGQGKARAQQNGALRRRAEWRVMMLSSGEIGLADHMRAAKRAERTMAGQELRLLDIPADAGAGMGAWENLHNLASPAALSDTIKAACAVHYGHAGPAFVRGLVVDPDYWEREAKQLVKAFVTRAGAEGDSGQVQRGALRFAAVAAAGEMATALGIVPWRTGEADSAALACFNAWAVGFGRTGLREHRQILERVRNAIQTGQSRFAAIPKARLSSFYGDDPDESAVASNREGEARSLTTLGFFHDIEPGSPCYLFHDSGWAEILAGFDQKEAAGVLQERGYLIPGDGGRPKRKQRVGEQSRRFYTVRAAILDWDASDLDGAGDSSSPEVLPAEPQPGHSRDNILPPGWDDFDSDADGIDPLAD